MERLMEERYPVYATADLIVDSQDVPHDQIVRQIVEKLATLTETP
jgi:shikimate kinase